MASQILSWPPAPTSAAHPQIFVDPRSQTLLAHLERVAPSEASVLIAGETGTGKELVARHIHRLSGRSAGRFIAVNCGAFSESLVDAELFGHEKGAFTGALSAKAGWFEEANGGTLFLDEIGDLPMLLQVKLLRVLQEREVVRLGSRKPIPIDVRVLAATNVKLEEMIEKGLFRKDLYYRLNVVTLNLNPLHQRPGDIIPLARHFIADYSQRLGYGDIQLSPDAERKLVAHGWPGNIRELENVIHHTLLLCRGDVITGEDLHLAPVRPSEGRPTAAHEAEINESPEELLQRAFLRYFEAHPAQVHEKIEDALLRTAYRFCRENQVHTATLLGLTRNITRTRLIKAGHLVVDKRGAGTPAGQERYALTQLAI